MQVRQLNENLEQLVEEKTRDIRSIMEHIQLGIFAITSPGRSIHKDYSRYLETLFKADERHQAAQALDAMLGEAALSFELNSAALPHETRYEESEGHTGIMDLSWHPVVNAQDIIEKVLVAKPSSASFKTVRNTWKRITSLSIPGAAPCVICRP